MFYVCLRKTSGDHANSCESASDCHVAKKTQKIRATHGHMARMCEKQVWGTETLVREKNPTNTIVSGFGGSVHNAETNPSYVLGKSGRRILTHAMGKMDQWRESNKLRLPRSSRVKFLVCVKELCCQERHKAGLEGAKKQSRLPGEVVRVPVVRVPGQDSKRGSIPAHTVHQASRWDAALRPSGRGILF